MLSFISLLLFVTLSTTNTTLVKIGLRGITKNLSIGIITLSTFSNTISTRAVESLQSVETQTISLFERTTPSVAYITTYIEKIDVSFITAIPFYYRYNIDFC